MSSDNSPPPIRFRSASLNKAAEWLGLEADGESLLGASNVAAPRPEGLGLGRSFVSHKRNALSLYRMSSKFTKRSRRESQTTAQDRTQQDAALPSKAETDLKKSKRFKKTELLQEKQKGPGT